MVIFFTVLPKESKIFILSQRCTVWIGMKYFENFVKIRQILTKNCIFFLQKWVSFKITFCVITLARIKLQTWNLVHICRKILQKTYTKRNFEFLIFNVIEFLFIFSIKSIKSQLKEDKTKIRIYKFFVIFWTLGIPDSVHSNRPCLSVRKSVP